ncbi:MAG: hypothetical protein WC384_07415 [Prolixibacteraceae bacterium]|jgi:hypothetical protein
MKFLKYTVVFSFLILNACHTKKGTEFNQSASVTSLDQLPENPLEQKVISSSVNTTKNEMSTLYGNDLAFQYARFYNDGNYPEGSSLYRVTWKQQDDPRWFGGKIPKAIESVEIVRFVKNDENKVVPDYTMYKGNPLSEVKNMGNLELFIKSIVEQRMAVIP